MREGERSTNKRYGVTFGLMILLWIWVVLVLVKIEPESVANWMIPGVYLPLVGPFFLGSLLLFSLVLGNSRRGVLLASFFVLSFYLRVYKIAQWWVLIALLVGVIFVEVFWSLKKVDKQE